MVIERIICLCVFFTSDLMEAAQTQDFGDKLVLLRQTPQVRGLHTIIRSRDTCREDFIFYSDRLNRLLIEEGLSHLPYREKRVVTPTGDEYVG